MINFTLEIDGPSSVTYGSDKITVERIEIEERTDRLQTEKGNVRVEVTDLFGWEGPDDVPPAEAYRTRLIREGEAVFDGVLETRDIAYTPERDTWDLLLTTDEVKRLQDSEVSFLASVDAGRAPDAYDVLAIVPSNSPGRTRRKVNVQTYPAHPLMQHCLDELVAAGIVSRYTLPPDPHPLEALDLWREGSEETYTTGLVVTPVSDDCYDNVRALAELFGWRMTADYASYPTDALELSFRPLDNTTNNGSLPTTRNERDVIEMNNVSGGLRLSDAEKTPDAPKEQIGTNDERQYFLPAHIPADRGVGAPTWSVEAPQPNPLDNQTATLPREFNTDLTDLTYSPCPVAVREYLTVGADDPGFDPDRATLIIPAGDALPRESAATEVEYDLSNATAPGLTFDIIYRKYTSGGLTLAETYVAHSRQEPGDQTQFTEGTTGRAESPTWIDTVYDNTRELRGFRKRLEAGVKGRVGLETIGSWHVERTRYDVDTGYSQIEAVEVVTSPRATAQDDVARFRVHNVRARRVDLGNADNYQEPTWLQIWWDRPPLRFDRAYWYEVEIRTNSSAGGPAITTPSEFSKDTWYYVIPPVGINTIGSPGADDPLADLSLPYWRRRHHTTALSVIWPFDDLLDDPSADKGKVDFRVTPYAETGEQGSPVTQDLREAMSAEDLPR